MKADDVLTRRSFLGRSILAMVSVGGASFFGEGRSDNISERRGATNRGETKKVVVIGAGLAGLTATLELIQKGYAVIVLEAQARAGGRVRTLRKPFSDGLYAEAGATRIPDNHDLTLSYCRLFDLPLIPFRTGGLATAYYISGKRFTTKRGGKVEWPVPLKEGERNLDIAELREKYIGPILTKINNAQDDDRWPPEILKTYDEMTWSEFLLKQGASSAAADLLTLGHNSGFNKSVSALSWLRYIILSHSRSRMYKIEGGNDRLTGAFAKEVQGKIEYNAIVTAIEETADKARVSMVQSGRQSVLECDFVVSAIPFSVLRTIHRSFNCSEEKRKAIDTLHHVSCMKICLQTKERFWLKENTDGFGLTDLPIAELWDASAFQEGKKGILQSYCTGDDAREFGRMAEDERVRNAVDQASRLYPDLSKNFEKGISYSWDEDTWARGAWAYFLPNEMTTFFHSMGKIEGRIHFAGDHTSPWPGWMQGAIHSGKRVAGEIAARM